MRLLPTLLAAASLAAVARPDATVVTRAMTASTVAEVFVEEGEVRVELEIGVADLAAFELLLPDAARARMGLAAEPEAARLARFFARGWTVRADGGEPLAGAVAAMEARRRIARDEITGEPLALQPQDAEPVIRAELRFPLESEPLSLALKPPGGRDGAARANIGFVLVHRGLPVNDFRYLAQEETVDLDWDDPWYSRFRNRNLWRQYDAPLSAFLYVEPFEVRKEVVVRPRDLQQWVDLGLEERDVIRPEEWEEVQRRAAEFLISRCPVRIDGREVEPVLERVHFIERTLRTSRVLEEPKELDAVSATMGVIISYPTTGLPGEATMEWELFPDRIASIPGSAVDEAGGLPTVLTPEDNVLRWQNFLKNPTRAKLVELEPPPARGRLSVPLASVVCLLGAALVAWLLRRKPAGRVAGAALALAAIAFWPFARVSLENPFAGPATLTEEQSRAVSRDLLRNVYRAFDYRTESDIYDVLAKSIRGELLRSVYLETRGALELENQGGARVRIQEVEVVEVDATPLDGGPGFTGRCTWNVAGSVGHWGHVHQRRNRYEADLTVQPLDGEWRITDLTLRDEARF